MSSLILLLICVLICLIAEAPLSGQAFLTGKEKHTSAMRSVLGENAGKKPLCWGLGHHVVCWLSNLMWNVFSHYLLITCPKMRNILGVAPVGLWLKNFMLESPRSSFISRRAANFLFATSSLASQYNKRNAEWITSSLDWSLRSISLWNAEILLIISASNADLCCW